MKQCPKEGLLNLQRSGPEKEWIRSSITSDSFSLVEYCRHLLRMSNIHDVPVWCTLNGWTLVPYQAVVLTKHWDTFWEIIEPLWGCMCTAHRLFHGGSSAPKL